MSGLFVLRNTETGKYVSRAGSQHSYTHRFDEVRFFHTRNEAEIDRCPDNEEVVHVCEAARHNMSRR